MKLSNIYDLAVTLGKKYDPRGQYLDIFLDEQKRDFEKLNEDEKLIYDQERLDNPYNDTRILFGSGEEEIDSILCGIDIETPEILLADRLREKGEKIDLILAHHPEGIAQAGLHGVMRVQADMLEKAGVPINIAEGIMASRISEVQRGLMPLNHQRAVDAARLLDFPFMCVHSPADNMVNDFLELLLEQNKITTVGDIIDILQEEPEYSKARHLKAGARILTGDKKRKAGKIFVKMTGGTSGSDKAYEKLAQAGVGTMLCMHMTEKHRLAAKDNHINVIITGHMASDSLGMNLLLDEIEREGIKIIPCSGLIRVQRSRGSS
ncbi:MAG: NGG1p interacting factor NIF3 [Syntrophomonadaceae bacterium]|nr:NGG1p interacting factor NIF3 [Syntrophomonadaceae bacterium]